MSKYIIWRSGIDLSISHIGGVMVRVR